MPAVSRTFLHIGSPKTGTTYLQAVVWESRDQLRQAGLLLPGESIHQHFQAALDVCGTPQRARFPRQVEGAWQRLVDGHAGWAGDALISHEFFASAPGDRAREAVAALEAAGREVHLVLTARDYGRQLPAEWQERLKHKGRLDFDRFMTAADDPETALYKRLWAAHDYADIMARWGADLPPERLHVVTVPPAGAPRTLLWERFAALVGIDPGAYNLEVPVQNSSLGVEQAELLRELNIALGPRLPLPGPYTGIAKYTLSHQILAARKGTRLVLGGDDLRFAERRAAAVIHALEERGVTVHGDLEELRPDMGLVDGVSTPRVPVADAVRAEEYAAVTADLLAAFGDRVMEWDVRRGRLREELDETHRRLRQATERAERLQAELDQVPARRARRAAGRWVRKARSRVGAGRERAPKVWLLMYSAHGGGGVARTTVNLANSLAAEREVEILSVYRSKPQSTFPIDPRVTVTFLAPYSQFRKEAPEQFRDLASRPSELGKGDRYTALTDQGMRAAFARMAPGDVLISTRPSLHGALTTLAPRQDVVRIGWDHLNFPARYRGKVGARIDEAIGDLDAFVVLTEADAADYRERHPSARVEVIRNAVSWPPAERRGNHDQKVIVAAGRLTRVKGFERLIEAWGMLAAEFPEWTLRIYGVGELREELLAQAAAVGGRIELPGYTDDMPGVLAAAGAFVMSSRLEGFPMSLLEALAEGTPLISFDCPRGPGEIVRSGRNGFLVPDGDIAELAVALRRVMRDPVLREQLGRQAHQDAQEYTIEKITHDWTGLMDELAAKRASG